MTALCLSQKCNWVQTHTERREKYWLCKSLGTTAGWAQRMRDWPLRKIERYFNMERKSLRLMPDGRIHRSYN